MRIRNTRHVRQLVPFLHVEADPGETVRVPADSPIPDGFELVEPPAPKPRGKTTARKTTSREPDAAPADSQEQ